MRTYRAGYLTGMLVCLFSTPVLAVNESCHVARAQFTTNIVNREPVDKVVVLDTESTQNLFYFTELQHCQGKTLTHRWEFSGKIITETPFVVKGPRWRVYSKKYLEPDNRGKWSVVVVDEAGWPLNATIFYYGVTPDVSGSKNPSHLILPN